jgi:hypothetical protein
MCTSVWTPSKSAVSGPISSDTDILVLAQAIVNLAEQSGKEGPITQAFREYVQELERKDVLYVFVVYVIYHPERGCRYHEYDFHKETKGMKYT